MPQSTPVITFTEQSGAATRPPSLIEKMADKFSVESTKLMATLKATAFKQPVDKTTGQMIEVTNEQMMALLVVADQYGLNPFTREVYAFADRGGIVPIVGVDGWSRIINEQKAFNGMHFDTVMDDKAQKPISVTCTMYRKDRDHPTVVTEYYRECKRSTGPWDSHPTRMLRHKAMMQCARIAFGFVGIYDEDEGERIIHGEATVVSQEGIDELNATVRPVPQTVVYASGPDRGSGGSGGGPVLSPGGKVYPESEQRVERPTGATDLAGGFTYAQVADAIKKAETIEALDLATDAMRSLPDEAMRAELDVEIRARRKALE